MKSKIFENVIFRSQILFSEGKTIHIGFLCTQLLRKKYDSAGFDARIKFVGSEWVMGETLKCTSAGA